MKKDSVFRRIVYPAVVILLANVIYAFGFVWCCHTNGIALGGVTGVAQIINHIFPQVPIGVCVIVLNVPLFLLGWKLIGGRLLISSLYAMFTGSLLIDFFSLFTWEPMDPVLACIFGGLSLGLALGIIIRQGATTGGTDLLARLLKLKLAWLPMGRLLLGIDLAVIVAAALVFRTLESGLYGLVGLYISTIVMDGVLYGLDTAKVAYIISSRSQEILDTLVHKLDRGVTILQGQGGYTGEDRKVLMCAFKQKEIAVLRAAVKEIDPDAFVIVTDAHEVLGEGFQDYKKNDV